VKFLRRFFWILPICGITPILSLAANPVFSLTKPGTSLEACYGHHLKRCVKFQYAKDYQVKYYLGEKFVEHKDVSQSEFSHHISQLQSFYELDMKSSNTNKWCRDALSIVRREDYVQITGQTWICLDRLSKTERDRFSRWMANLRQISTPSTQ